MNQRSKSARLEFPKKNKNKILTLNREKKKFEREKRNLEKRGRKKIKKKERVFWVLDFFFLFISRKDMRVYYIVRVG